VGVLSVFFIEAEPINTFLLKNNDVSQETTFWLGDQILSFFCLLDGCR